MHFDGVILQPKTKQKKHRKMKNTNPIFSLKNFRSFGEEGADFELAPITVLTGCNSSGKSSLVKALLLLSRLIGNESYNNPFQLDSFVAVINDIRGDELSTSARELSLGGYDKILNNYSKNGKIELSYTTWSPILREVVHVVRVFEEDKKDPLKNGHMINVRIEKEDGTLIFNGFTGMSNDEEDAFGEEFVSSPQQSYRPETIRKAINQLDSLSDYFSLRQEYDKNEKLLDALKIKDKHTMDSTLQRVKNSFAKDKENLDKAKIRIEENGVPIDLCEELENEYLRERQWYQHSVAMDIIREWSSIRKDSMEDWRKEVHLAIRSNNEKEVKFLNFTAKSLLNPAFLSNAKYINSASAEISRRYSIDSGDKLNVALRLFLQRKKKIRGGVPDINGMVFTFPGDFITRWLKAFSVGDKVDICGAEEGQDVLVYLYKNGEKRLLADEGYGITQLFSLLLQIDNCMPGFIDVGVPGVPSIPRNSLSYICVEEPEIHLHPKYQSLLADMFVEAYQKYNIHFIIETHSEYLIRKLQVLVADKENELAPNDVSLNYVDKDENGISTNRKIEILEDGRLSEPFGPGFFDEADSLAMDLMKFKVRR